LPSRICRARRSLGAARAGTVVVVSGPTAARSAHSTMHSCVIMWWWWWWWLCNKQHADGKQTMGEIISLEDETVETKPSHFLVGLIILGCSWCTLCATHHCRYKSRLGSEPILLQCQSVMEMDKFHHFVRFFYTYLCPFFVLKKRAWHCTLQWRENKWHGRASIHAIECAMTYTHTHTQIVHLVVETMRAPECKRIPTKRGEHLEQFKLLTR
jgi:hypothetical protein